MRRPRLLRRDPRLGAFDEEVRWTAASGYTTARALGTSYTAGRQRRHVTAIITVPLGVTLTISHVVGGKTLSWALPAAVLSLSLGTLGTITLPAIIPIQVDPGGAYSITASGLLAGSTVMNAWVEVDG